MQHISGGVSTLGFKSFDSGRTKFQGTRRKVIHLDEEPPLDIYTECCMRIAGFDDEPGIILTTMTPLSGMTKLLQESLFFGDAVEGFVNDRGKSFVQVGWEDNSYLPQSEREFLLKSTPPHELEARQKGIPALGSGMVYPVAESKFVIEPIELGKYWGRVFGLDFGWTNPTAALFGAYDRDRDILFIYAEYYQKELTPQTHSNNLMRMGADWIPGVCDPAGLQADKQDGKNLFDTYSRHGLNLTLADNSKEAGIMAVLERLQSGRLKVFNTCTNLLSELRMYARDEKGNPKKVNDHLCDDLRYIVMSGLPRAMNEYESQDIRADNDNSYSDGRSTVGGY